MRPKPKDNKEIMTGLTADPSGSLIEVSDLTILDRVFLGTLLRTGLSENKESLIIQDFPESPVAPSLALLSEMVSKLIERKLIIPKGQPLIEFNGNFAYSKTNVEMNKLEFSINVKNFESNDVIEYLLMPRIDPDAYETELITIWKTIAVEECKSYLHYSLNVSMRAGRSCICFKTSVIFRNF